MANPFPLVHDVFTFLSFLHSHDLKPIGARFLSAAALEQLNAQLIISDVLEKEYPRGGRGKYLRTSQTKLTERQTERIRFLHFLAESAQLIAVTGAFIKPTLYAARWLNASNLERARILFTSAFPKRFTRAHAQLWRAYRLPGSHLAAPGEFYAPLVTLLRELSSDMSVKLSTLEKLLDMPAFEDDKPEHQPHALLCAALKLFEWFGILTWRNPHVIQLTPLGCQLLERTDAHALAPDSPLVEPVRWMNSNSRALPNLSASPNADLRALYELATYANHVSTLSTTRTFRRIYCLDAEKIRRALDQGVTIMDVREFLETIADCALPPRVSEWLDGIARAYGQITLRHVTLLEVDEPARLTTLTRSKHIRECIKRTLSPRAVVVKPQHVQPLIRRLNQRVRNADPSVPYPRLELASSYQSPSAPMSHSPNAPNAPFSQSSLAQLYLAARLTHQLAPMLPKQYRPAYSILHELEQHLSPSDIEIANELAMHAARIITTQRQTTAWHKSRPAISSETQDRDFSPAADRLPETLAHIQRALKRNMPLAIAYYSPYQNETTHRVVEPLRLEDRDDRHYLIAFCHRDQAERTFRVDRILQIADSESQTRGERSRTMADGELQIANRK